MLEELRNILDEIKNTVNESEVNNLKLQFTNADTYVSENESKLLSNIPISKGEIKLKLEVPKGDIVIEFGNTRSYDWNTLTVSGQDSTWVYGISKRIEQNCQATLDVVRILRN